MKQRNVLVLAFWSGLCLMFATPVTLARDSVLQDGASSTGWRSRLEAWVWSLWEDGDLIRYNNEGWEPGPRSGGSRPTGTMPGRSRQTGTRSGLNRQTGSKEGQPEHGGIEEPGVLETGAGQEG